MALSNNKRGHYSEMQYRTWQYRSQVHRLPSFINPWQQILHPSTNAAWNIQTKHVQHWCERFSRRQKIKGRLEQSISLSPLSSRRSEGVFHSFFRHITFAILFKSITGWSWIWSIYATAGLISTSMAVHRAVKLILVTQYIHVRNTDFQQNAGPLADKALKHKVLPALLFCDGKPVACYWNIICANATSRTYCSVQI